MPMTLDDTKPGDARNALFLAQACNLAYLDALDGAARFRDELGLDAVLISTGNTQVYVAQNDKVVVVAFRGSQAPNTLDGLKDWLLTNANNYLILPEGQIGTDFAAAGVGAQFHRGFMEALHEIWEPLLASVAKALESSERPLWVTGHSLGGALALLASWRLRRNFVTVHEVVTFGAPMIGNEATARAFEQEFAGKIFRYVNFEDPVPLLPTISLVANTYAHCQSEVSLAAMAAVASALDTLKESTGSAPGSPDRGQPDRSSLESRPESDLRPLHRPLRGTGEGEMRGWRSTLRLLQKHLPLPDHHRGTKISPDHLLLVIRPMAQLRETFHEESGFREARAFLPGQGLRPGRAEGHVGTCALRVEGPDDARRLRGHDRQRQDRVWAWRCWKRRRSTASR